MTENLGSIFWVLENVSISDYQGFIVCEKGGKIISGIVKSCIMGFNLDYIDESQTRFTILATHDRTIGGTVDYDKIDQFVKWFTRVVGA